MNIIRRHTWFWTAGVLVLMAFQPSICAAGVSDYDLSERSVRGKTISEAVTQLTGTAVNPLFGVTVLGMYQYFTTPPDLRDQLPFYDQPYVWGGMLLIILLMLFNSTICESIPFLKIPLNALGDLVNKGGTCIVLPIVLHQFAQAFAAPTADVLATACDWVFPAAYAAENVGNAGGGDWFAIGWAVSWVLGAITYATVWMVCNVIDVIILILPIPFLDAFLKSVRHGVMALVFGAAALNPWLGLLVSVILVFICWCLAGWAFRLSVMGFIFATDILLWRKSGNIDPTVGVPAFTTAMAAKQWKRPARLYGRLRRGPGNSLYFVWRPWLIGPLRKVDLGQSKNFQCGSSLLYPVVLEDTGEKPLFRLPPRYRRDSRVIADTLGLIDQREVSVVRGILKSFRLFSARNLTIATLILFPSCFFGSSW